MKLVYNTSNVNAGTFGGNETCSVVNAGIYVYYTVYVFTLFILFIHSSNAGAVPVIKDEKLHT